MDDEGPAFLKNHDTMKGKETFRERENITTAMAF